MDVPLRIERDAAGVRGHGDLAIHVAAHVHRCDSCYFSYFSVEHGDGTATVEGSLARLLDQWLVDLAAIGRRCGAAYLPIDLSDQCSAWLEVTDSGGGLVTVRLGWTSVEGWSIDPFDGDAASRITAFEPIPGALFTALLDDLVAQVRMLRAGFAIGCP